MSEVWGLLIDWVGNEYTQTIIKTAAIYCREHDISLVVYTIGPLSFTLESDSFHNHILPLTEDPLLSRILICSAQLSIMGGLALLEKHFEKFATKPIVCLGGALNNFPIVQSDVKVVINQLMQHLHQHHGYTRFAWVSGPPDNPDSRKRETEFLEYVHAHDLPLNPELLLVGDFNLGSGKDAGRRLLQLSGCWDAVVAANDTMADGLREVLGPSAIICGFDNESSSQFNQLTTIDPNLPGQVTVALDLLGSLHQDGTSRLHSRTIKVDGNLIIRSSCGCAPTNFEKVTTGGKPQRGTDRIVGIAEGILPCSDMDTLEAYLNTVLPDENISYWKLIPPREIGLKPDNAVSVIPQAGSLLAPFTLLVHSLFLKKELFGYLALDIGGLDFGLSECLRLNISFLLQSWARRNMGVQVQKLLSLEIEKQERRRINIEQVFNSLPVLIIEVDRHLNLRYLNQRAMKLFNLTSVQNIVRPYMNFVAPHDRQKLTDRLNHCLTHKVSTGCEFRLATEGNNPASIIAEIEPIDEGRNLNLTSLFGSLRFEGGLRLTGFDVRSLLERVSQPEHLFFKHFCFTPRERKVIDLLVMGYDNAEIAKTLRVLETTIRVFLHSIYKKTGVGSRKDFLDVMAEYQHTQISPHSLTQTLLARLISKS